jgi:hypothetical protein
LLTVRGWDTSRPPRGHLLRKQEYRQYPLLSDALAHRSKTGHERGYPDFLVVERESVEPLLVIEAKAHDAELPKALHDANFYAEAFFERGYHPLSVGVAGTGESEISVAVSKWAQKDWKRICYRNKPIQWIPTLEESHRLLHDDHLFALDPEVPSPDVLANCADQINRILRECRIKDEFRPAVLAAFMLGLSRAEGKINPHPEYVLQNINSACTRAFEGSGKFEIAGTLKLPEENDKLAQQAAQICYILRLLNVTTLTSAHDYLGQLYEEFFRFTGGNTIGQYFTPRHVAKFMTELCEVSKSDLVLDPTCGTGGFLIAALYRMIEGTRPTKRELASLVKTHLMGFESEPITAALCVANMILRGDGATGVRKDDCFTSAEYPVNKMTVVLGNPPFPHKKTDDPPDKFVDRSLEALAPRGRLAMIVPSSLLSKREYATWRQRVLKGNTLRAVIKLPDELFQPFASSYADILVLEKGIPHRRNAKVFFCYIDDDGYKIKKRVRIRRSDGKMPIALEAFRNSSDVPGICSLSSLPLIDQGGPWGPGGHVAVVSHTFDELSDEIGTVVRNQVAFQVQFADSLARSREAIEDGRLAVVSYRDLASRRRPVRGTAPNSLGALFDIYYGQRELHSKEHLAEGNGMVISSKGTDNGCYGFFGLKTLLEPPFVAVPSSGSIGEASVQLFPCGITDDCLVLIPKAGTEVEELWTVAAKLRKERWRFHYGYKLTPDRIRNFTIPRSAEMNASIRAVIESIMPSARQLVSAMARMRETARGSTGVDGRFVSLAKRWRSETRLVNNVSRRTKHPAYQEIIAMGERAVPLILRDLAENGPSDWFVAITAITGENPITEEMAGDMTLMTEAWLRWGTAMGYLKDYRLRTKRASQTSEQ